MMNAVIELAIGLIVLYSMLSLVCSRVNELVASVLSLRGRNLLKAVRHLVGDDCGDRVYAHPLVRSLYTDDPPRRESSRLARLRGRLPSYLPAEKFVIAVLEYAVPSAVRAPPPLPPDPRALVPTEPSPPAAGSPAQPVSPGASPTDWSRSIGEELDRIGEPRLKSSLCSIWNAASHDVVAFRAGVEEWFNHTMDRASGWYKRRTQLMLLILGLAIAIGLNVDTIRVTQRLWTDAPLRSAVAEEVKKLPVPATTTPPVAPVGPSGTTSTTTGQLGTQVDQIEKDLRQVTALRLPLGWGRGLTPSGALGWLAALAGWVITAIALSLGAPFWFDLLAKFTNVRGTGTKEPTPAQEAKATTRK